MWSPPLSRMCGSDVYALQDKVRVHGPGAEPWEVYVVKADADTLGKSAALEQEQASCCQEGAS